MLKVFYKSDEEMERAAYGWRGAVCSAYVLDKEGRRFDVTDLNERQYLSFIWQGVMQGAKEQHAAQATNPAADFDPWHYQGTQEVARLLFVAEDTFRPTNDGMRTLVDLMYHRDPAVSQLAQGVLKDTLKRKHFAPVVQLAESLKAEAGQADAPLSKEDWLRALNQIQEQERAK